MALGFSSRPDNVPYIRYNAMGPRRGTFSDRDHEDILFVALCDFEYIKTGWVLD